MKLRKIIALSTFCIAFISGCAEQSSDQLQIERDDDLTMVKTTVLNCQDRGGYYYGYKDTQDDDIVSCFSLPIPWDDDLPIVKTTVLNCQDRGGYYYGYKYTQDNDIVSCFTLHSGKDDKVGDVIVLARSIKPKTLRSLLGQQPHILGSGYDYLHETGTEDPQYGLYSYVLLPVPSPRGERLLKGLFKTTSFVELSEIDFGNLNIIYLPTRNMSLLIPKISDGSPPPVDLFAKQFYNYALAQKLLAQICTSPSKEITDVCSTDLSRGPYLFTFTHPASNLVPVPPPYLFVDLSSVHEGAFGEFIVAYKEQVKRTDYSDRERIDNLRLRILSIILTAADWVGPIKGAMADIVHMSKENKRDM